MEKEKNKMEEETKKIKELKKKAEQEKNNINKERNKGPPPVAKGSLKPTRPQPTGRGQPPSARSLRLAQGSPPPGAKGPPPAAKGPPPGAKGPPPAAKGPPPAAKGPPPAAKGPSPAAKGPSPAAKGTAIQTSKSVGSSGKTETAELKISELSNDQILAQICGPNGVEIKDRKWRLRTYPQCFVGNELTTWLVDNKIAPNRKSAVLIGEKLRGKGAFSHVTSDHPFQDTYFFYHFKNKGGRDRGYTSARQAQDSTAVETPKMKKDIADMKTEFNKSGYALKRMGVGPDALHFWEVKYFLISKAGSNFKFEYYASHCMSRRLGNLTLSNQSTCFTLQRDAFADGNHGMMFAIKDRPDGKTIILDAESNSVRDEWLETFASIGVQNTGVQCDRINSSSVREGWVKQAPEGFGVWHRRYLILLPNVLLYYKWKRDKRPLGAIPLMKKTKIEEGQRVSTFELTPDPNAINQTANPAGRTYIITCYDDQLLKSWMDSISACLQKL